MRSSKKLLLCGLIVIFASAIGARTLRADSLIVNGSFETGNFTGWNTTGDLALCYYSQAYCQSYDGNWAVAFNSGDTAPNGVLSQTFATVAGQTYDVSFAYSLVDFSGSSQTMDVSVNGRDVLNATVQSCAVTQNCIYGYNPGSGLSPWSLFNVTFAATSASTTLTFTDDPNNYTFSTDGLLDDVSVTSVPECSSLILLCVGLLGFARIYRPVTRQGRSERAQ